MKHLVLKYFTKQNEGFKPYNVGDEIELTKDEAKRLVAAGLVKPKRNAKTKK